jgi:cytochrome b
MRVVIWDLPTRLFHWSTVVLLLVLYLTERLNWMDLHIWAGYILLALVIFRLVWGFVGSDTARFSRFMAPPLKALHHLQRIFHREPDTMVGHNPAGGWMVLFMLALLLVQSLSGIYTNNDVANEGRWSEVVPAAISNAISDSHTWVWYVILAAVVLHVVAIATYAAVKRHNLVAAMVTGRKALSEPCAHPRMAKPWLAGPVLLIAAAITFVLAYVL